MKEFRYYDNLRAIKNETAQTEEEKFKAEHEQEKQQAQDAVDSVLNGDTTNREYTASGGVSSSSSETSQPPPKPRSKLLNTLTTMPSTSHPEVSQTSSSPTKTAVRPAKATVHETARQTARNVMTRNTIKPITANNSHSSADSDVSDFEQNPNDIDMQNVTVAAPKVDNEQPMQSEPDINSDNNIQKPTQDTDIQESEPQETHVEQIEEQAAESVSEQNSEQTDADFNEEPVAPKSGSDMDRQIAERVNRQRDENRRKRAADAEKQASSVRSNVEDTNIPNSNLKQFPTELAKFVQGLFTGNPSMQDAIAAYVYLQAGRPAEIRVPQKIKDLADNYAGEEVSVSDLKYEFSREIAELKKTNLKVTAKLNAIELAVGYNIFDRFGFRKKEALSSAEIDFLESGIDDLLKRLERMAATKQARDNARDGAPKR